MERGKVKMHTICKFFLNFFKKIGETKIYDSDCFKDLCLSSPKKQKEKEKEKRILLSSATVFQQSAQKLSGHALLAKAPRIS